jgi:hypothetical protein
MEALRRRRAELEAKTDALRAVNRGRGGATPRGRAAEGAGDLTRGSSPPPSAARPPAAGEEPRRGACELRPPAAAAGGALSEGTIDAYLQAAELVPEFGGAAERALAQGSLAGLLFATGHGADPELEIMY